MWGRHALKANPNGIKTLDSTAADTLPDLRADLRCVPPLAICVQLVHKEAVLKGVKRELINAESTTDS